MTNRFLLLWGIGCIALGPSLATAAAPATRVREEIPPEYRWDFTPIYADWAAWEAGMKEFERQMDAFGALKGTLAQGPQAVLAAYRAFDDIGILSYRVYLYPMLQRDVDTRNQDVSGKFQRVGAAFARFRTATSWFTPELLSIPQETMERWLEATPDLAPYRFGILESYRQQAHVLDADGERLLSYASRFNGTPASAYQELSTSDIRFPTVKLSNGDEVTATYGAYLSALQTRYEQSDRASVFAAHVGTYAATANTYAALYNAVLQRDWFLAQARNYPTTLEAALDDDAVPPAVVENLVATVRAGTAPLQRYARLRKRLLGLDSYHLYDSSIPIYRTDRTYPFEEARELVASSIAPLGEDYGKRFREFVAGGRIDVYENEGKRSGAYSAGVYGVGPYQLLNYSDTLDSLFTFAHEAGHAIHVLAFGAADQYRINRHAPVLQKELVHRGTRIQTCRERRHDIDAHDLVVGLVLFLDLHAEVDVDGPTLPSDCTTRLHGTLTMSSFLLMARPTNLLATTSPNALATSPSVVTLPKGTWDTRS